MKKIFLFWVAGIFVLNLSICACEKENPNGPDEDEPEEDTLKIQISPKIIGFVPYEVSESSGMAITAPGKIWSHNDSGGKNELYCIDFSGHVLKTLRINNATNIDWEELAADNQKRVYIGDFGNNNNGRKDQVIYRIPDPESVSENAVEAETIFFSFEDQTAFPPPAYERHFDVEAMVWKNDSLFLFTKDRSSPLAGITKLYKLPASPGTHIARLAGSIITGNTTTAARVTSADIDPVSGDLALLMQEKLIVFRNYPGNQFFEGKKIEYPFVPMPGQVEAIFFFGRKTLFMTEEIASVENGKIYELTLP